MKGSSNLPKSLRQMKSIGVDTRQKLLKPIGGDPRSKTPSKHIPKHITKLPLKKVKS